jgi:GNAT superfamily N-acetyltransferase
MYDSSPFHSITGSVRQQLIRSPLALHLAAKDIDNYPGEGTSILSACRAITYFGRRSHRQFFYEPLWRYDFVLDVARSNIWLDDAYASRYMEHLAFGFAIFEGVHSAPLGRLQLPLAGQRPIAYHAQLAGWADNGESLGFANSWGPKWGDHGLGTISREYWNAHILEAWLSRQARWGPSPYTWDRLVNARSPVEYAQAWKSENHRWRQRIKFGRYGHQLMLWEAISWTGRPVEVIEIRDGRGIRVAWSELFFEGRAAVVKEFFVWPNKRRQGYGRLLESLCVERARSRHANRLLVWFHQQDAVLSVRRAGREFALNLGYVWRWTREIPRVVAVGRKDV